jgi:aminopeptidase N
MRIVAFFFFCCLVGNLKAEEEFSFESAPGKLPKTIAPRHYVIHLEPDESQMTVDGAEAVEIEVLKPTRQIVMNAGEMKIWNATLSHSGAREKLVPQQDLNEQQVKFETAQDLRPGAYTLSFCFKSPINTESRGFFLQHYQSNGKTETILATQMRPDKARQMFPCWDEPAFRATFQLSVKVDKKTSAVSNMPDVAEEPVGTDKKIVIFGRSPPMSTYLVSLICGRLDSIEDQVDGVKLRVFTIPGKAKLGAFALENERKLLTYYRDYFGIPYPLPKLDQIALPQNFGGSVESWGAIAYDENLLLYDPLNSASQAQEKIFATMSRAIAQQWFGDLVTMAWWNNRWLSESLSSWIAHKAEDKLHPEWRSWLRATADREQAMAQDERSDTRPIQPPISRDQQVDDGFDNIVAWKGQYVIRMLEGFLGDESFQNGMRLYLKQNQFSNATAANLWAALDKTSGRSVSQIVSPWLTRPGYPLIRVTAECLKSKQVVTLEQSRFTLEPAPGNEQQWIIPVGILSTFNPHRPSYALLDKITQTFDFPDCWGALNVNANDLGFYRVWYDPDLFAKLLREWDRLSEEERVDVVSDSWAMVISNRSPIATYLTLLESLERETSYSVWHSILQALIAIDRLEQGQPGRPAYQAYVCSLLNPLLERLGWYPTNDEELATKLFRNELIETLSIFGDRSVINQAFERFEQMRKDPNSATPDLRGAVVAVVGRYSSETVYAQLHQLAHDATLLEAKDDYYHAMECALDPKLAEKTLELAISDELSPAESASAFAKVASEGEHADLAWNFVKSRLDLLEKSRSQTLWTVLVPAIVEGMYDPETAGEILNLSKNRSTGNGLVRTQMAVDSLQGRAKLRERLLPDIDDWVKKRAGTRVEAVPKSPAVTSTFITSTAPSVGAVSTPGVKNSTPTPTSEPAAVKIVAVPEPKVIVVPSESPPLALITSTPAPSPESTAVKIVVAPEPKLTVVPSTRPSVALVTSTSAPTPESTAVKIVVAPGPKVTAVPSTSPSVASVNSTPAPRPESTVRVVVAPEPKGTPETKETPELAPLPSAELAKTKPPLPPAPVSTPTPLPQPLTMIQSIAGPIQTAGPEPSPTPETVPTPSANPPASASSAQSTTQRESPKAEENSASTPPSETVAPEPSPTVQKRAIARHSATPKPEPTPTPTPKPKTLIGQIFDKLRRANAEASAPTPTPTPFVRIWASPTPKSKGGKASPSPTPRWMGKSWGQE